MEVSRRPQAGKHLELTPLWESVLRYSRLPEQTDPPALFAELSLRLVDPEWEVRQHALRVLSDILPVLSPADLDPLMIPSVLTDVTLNLGHSAAGVRKGALDVLLSYLHNTSDSEFVLRSILSLGLDSPTAHPSLTANVMSSLPTLIDGAVAEGENISNQSLVHLVTSISKKLNNMSTQQDALESLSKIRNIVGENRFDHFLESYYPEVKRDLAVLCKAYQVNNVRDSGIDLQSLDGRSDSASPKNEDSPEEGRKVVLQEQISFEDGSVTMMVTEENIGETDEKRTPRRVRFGGEQVKVRTPDSDVTVDTQGSMERSNSADTAEEAEPIEEENNKTPTKDELKPPTEEMNDEPSFSIIGPEKAEEASPSKRGKKKSQIPLPISPALHLPHARRSRFVVSRVRSEESLVRGVTGAAKELPRDLVPTKDGGESLTSSSEGEQDLLRAHGMGLGSLSFLSPHLLSLLHDKDDWRQVTEGLDALPDLNLSGKEWRSVVVYLTSRLSEPRPARLLSSTLRALGRCLPRLSPGALEPLVPWLVPALARRLASAPLPAKMEAALALQSLMRQAGPRRVVKVLLSERGLTSRSSKLRENSLLGLLYALMTYPSSEFDTSLMTEKIIAMAPNEPKRRVRQALLETLAVLAQFVPRQKLLLSPEKLSAPGGASFSEALAARLSRRILPAVSPDGLVLYALHIPPMTGRDVDWVLSGSGSLSSGSARSRSQLDLAQRDVSSSTYKDVFNNWSKDDMMAIGTALPPRNFAYSHRQGEDRYYDQIWAAEPHQGLHFSPSQSLTRPIYLRYQNGQSDLQRGNVPDQGFPQLSASYSSGLNNIRRAPELSQTWGGSRWGESPPHVSINPVLPPIGPVGDWRPSTRWQPSPSQADQGQRIVIQDDRRIGRWSRRQEGPQYHTRPAYEKVNRNMNYSESTPKSTRTVENGYLTRSPLISRSESSLVDDGLEERRLGEGRKQDQPSSGLTVLSASTGELVRSSPSLARPAVSPLHNQAQQSEDSSSSNNSLASVHSIHPQENNSPSEEEDALEEKEKAEEKNDETATNEEQVENGSKENIAGDVNGNPRSEAQQESQEMSVEDVDENENPNASEIGTPDTKSLGTPSSEFGSESSKTTQTSGNTIDSLTNGDEKPRRRGIPRRIGLRSRSSITPSSKDRPPLFPPTLPPFENPKDALTKTLLQLENPEWEVVMQGLQGLVRLARHHSKMLTVTPHPVVTALVRNIRNLRSQVSRGSCQASIEVFDSMGRFLDTEVEDLAGALLSRTADTNKFLRGDALSALQSMVDHTSPVRSIGILANKGSKHQNALVRCATSHLLLRLTKKLGAERCLSLPKESRDLLILTSAKLLTEGSLDTRKYAKEIFQQLNADPRLLTVMSEVVPNNILRNISKVLSKIAITSKK